jgi:hypothetical protein
MEASHWLAHTRPRACRSRSHTVFTVYVHVKELNDRGEELLKIGACMPTRLSSNMFCRGDSSEVRTFLKRIFVNGIC